MTLNKPTARYRHYDKAVNLLSAKVFVEGLLYVKPIDYEASAKLEQLIYANDRLRAELMAEQSRRIRMLELYVDLKEYCSELERCVVQ